MTHIRLNPVTKTADASKLKSPSLQSELRAHRLHLNPCKNEWPNR